MYADAETIHHIVGVIFALAILLIVVSLYIGWPYLTYVTFVSNADTDKGREDLAKYLAGQAGGKKIDVSDRWKSFIPAAKDLNKVHVERRSSISDS